MAELITIARPYAKAAFQFALESDAVAAWSEMLGFAAVVVADEAMHDYLAQPQLTAEQQIEAMSSVCGEKLSEKGKNFLIQLASHKRLTALPAIYVLFAQLEAEQTKTADVEVVSAFELSDEQLANIAESMKKRLGTDVRMSTQVDTTLIGGVLIKSGDLVIDSSVRGKIAKLSEALNA